MAEIDTLINAHHVQRAVDLSRSLITLCKEGMRYYHTYHRLPLKVAVTAGFVGWLACVLVQSTPTQYYWYSSVGPICVGAEAAFRTAWQGMATNQPRIQDLAKGGAVLLEGRHIDKECMRSQGQIRKAGGGVLSVLGPIRKAGGGGAVRFRPDTKNGGGGGGAGAVRFRPDTKSGVGCPF